MWFTASSVTATNNSNVVKINSNESIVNVKPGDALIIGSFNPVEILKAYASDQGSFIHLAEPWTNATQSQVPALVLPTRSALNEAITAINGANKLVNDNYQAILDWQTKTGEVTFKGFDNQEVTIKTAKQLELDVKAVQPYPWAMRKVQFEANRKLNLEKYEASGFVNHGLHIDTDANPAVGNGLWTWLGSPNLMSLGVAETDSGGQGKSRTKHATVNIAGVLTDLKRISHVNYVFIKLPPTEDGTRTYDSAAGISVRHDTPALAFLAENTTNKVVTDRQDGWGILQFKQEINDEYPMVYEHGLPQSHASHINGVPTVVNNIQQIEYFAQFDGDTTSRGRGVNWLTASDEQRAIISSDPANKIEFDDITGKFYQTHNFILTWAGMGNGDWQNIDAITGDLQFDAFNKIVPTITNAGKFTAGNFKGVFTANNNPDCHILFCGTVNRLNQGASHPSLNHLGAGYHRVQSNPNSKGHGSLFGSPNFIPINSKEEAFDPELVRIPSASHSYEWGSIGTLSARPDGRFFDAIYATGAGGVCRDMRYSANGLSLEDFTKSDLKIKSGEYRGLEKLFKIQFKFSTPFYFSNVNTNSNVYFRAGANNTGSLFDFESSGITSGASVIVHQPQTGYIGYGALHPATGHIKLLSHKDNLTTKISGSYIGNMTRVDPCYILEVEPISSIVGEYTHTDVIGDPAKILLCDALKSGWVGGWIPEIPNGTSKKYPLTRPHKDKLPLSFTVDNGATWASYSEWSSLALFDDTKNEWTASFPANAVYVISFSTKADMTKPSNNSVVYGAQKGLGDVFVSQGYLDWSGAQLGFSLLNKVMDSSGDASNLFFNNLPLSEYSFYQGKLGQWSSNSKVNPRHKTDYNFGIPENNPVGFKALSYATEINGQMFICYAYAELLYDTTAGNWGDDGQIHPINGQSTKPDLNGHTVNLGTAIISEPLGWIKNDK